MLYVVGATNVQGWQQEVSTVILHITKCNINVCPGTMFILVIIAAMDMTKRFTKDFHASVVCKISSELRRPTSE